MSRPVNPYDSIARAYADKIEDNVWNARYERPNALRLVGDVSGQRVLDAGCGPGAHAAALVDGGAVVTAIDASSELLTIAATRLGDRASIAQADLADPLPFPDESFDVVLASLTLHYLRDWGPTLAEFRRVLTAEGRLVLSTHHPTLSHRIGEGDDYFAVYEFDDEWEVGGELVRMRYWHRPLSAIWRSITDSGFTIETFEEPMPDPAVRELDRDAWRKLTTQPWFLFVVARPG